MPTIALSIPEVSKVTIPSKRFPRFAQARKLLTVVPCLSKKFFLATPLLRHCALYSVPKKKRKELEEMKGMI